MSTSDSVFLFEIMVQLHQSYVNNNDFWVFVRFADLFSLYLKNPNELQVTDPKTTQKKLNRKRRDSKIKIKNSSGDPNINVGQVLVTKDVDSLILNMKTYPLLLTLHPRNDPVCKLGSARIYWELAIMNYLNDLTRKRDVPPVIVEKDYNISNEISSNCIATIKMSIKLTCLDNKVTTHFKYLSKDNRQNNVDTGFYTQPSRTSNAIKQNVIRKTGNVKTIYSDHRKRYSKASKTTGARTINSKNIQPKKDFTYSNISSKINQRGWNLEKNKQIVDKKSKSQSSLENGSRFDTLGYIFGDEKGSYGNKVYCVGYCTVDNDNPSKTISEATNGSDKSEAEQKFRFSICGSECTSKRSGFCPSHCTLDLPADAAPLITLCDNVNCDIKTHRNPPPRSDDRVLMGLSSRHKSCCDVREKVSMKVEQIVGGVTAKMKIGKRDPCYCSCECRFGFEKKTTYCNICGGYELITDEQSKKLGPDRHFLCPVFHKLMDKTKQKSSNSSLKKKPAAVVESGKDNKKGKNKKTNDKFKFNYGYQGIPPQIGHSQCAMPCSGTLGNVPKTMGWLWTAQNVPGMKFRPNWKPGATSKHVVRLLRLAKNPDQVKSKKRKKDTGKKRPLKRPLLIVHKKDGEYTITMETMKPYTRKRAINQHPYEDKPPVTYTIGRSEEENRERFRKKQRVQRRLERAQRDFIQSTFKDMCKDICVKTYQQALGILPNAEDPECICYPANPGPDRTNFDVSCSCSEDSASLGSATDSDEWIVEFTPPNALFDPTYKGKKLAKIDNSTQYTYLDYRVKLLDRLGNPVVRFFTGPDGKQQCSDLGGFWSPDHKWLEINVDGFIAPDNRWAPNVFIGPNGEQVDAENGKFQSSNGRWLVIGVDGYIDHFGKWRFYPKPRGLLTQKRAGTTKTRHKDKKLESNIPITKLSEGTWSCFGDASPRVLGEMGIMGHGLDKKLLMTTLKEMLDRGENVTIPQPAMIPRRVDSKKGKSRTHRSDHYKQSNFEDFKCRHPVPSEKGIEAVDAHGNKIYFKLKNFKNTRAKERLVDLTHQGISLSSFHVPCFSSFINSEIIKQQQRERLMAHAKNDTNVATQVNY